VDLDDLVGLDIFKDALQAARPINSHLRGLRLVGETKGQAGFNGGTGVRAEVLGEGGGGGGWVFALEEVTYGCMWSSLKIFIKVCIIPSKVIIPRVLCKIIAYNSTIWFSSLPPCVSP
jgi:hypothetical protein